jgi:hypothetical protein
VDALGAGLLASPLSLSNLCACAEKNMISHTSANARQCKFLESLITNKMAYAHLELDGQLALLRVQ